MLRAALGKRESERKRPRLRRGGTGSAAGGGDPYRGRCAPRQKRRRGSRGKRGKPCAAAQGSPPPVPLRGRRGSGGQAAAKPQTRHSSKTLTVKAKNDILKLWRRRVGASQPDEWNRPARCVRAFSFAYVRAAARGSPPPVPLPSPSGGSVYREGMRLLLTTAECWDRLRVDPSFSYTLPTLLQASAFGAGLFCCPAAGLCAGRAARPGTQGQASAPGRAAAGEAGAGLSAAPLNRRLAKLQSKGLRWQFQGVPPR